MATLEFDSLKSKYNDFKLPIFQIEVEGTSLDDEMINMIDRISLNLTCNLDEMNILEFSLSNLYDYKKQSFESDKIKKYFKIGNKVELALGYRKNKADKAQKKLFKGYIYETKYNLNVEEGISISVTCKDLKGLLENKQVSRSDSINNLAAEVKDILSQYSSYATLAKGQSGNLEALLSSYNESPKNKDTFLTDLEKVKELALLTQHEFFVIYNEIYFRPIKDGGNQEVLINLSPSKGIVSVSMGYCIKDIPKKVEIRGYDVDSLDEISKEKSVSIESSVTTNKDALAEVIKSGEKGYRINTIEEAGIKLEDFINQHKETGSDLSVETIGLPDIVPGQNVMLEDLSSEINKSVYVKSVTHTIDTSSGYTTSFVGGSMPQGEVEKLAQVMKQQEEVLNNQKGSIKGILMGEVIELYNKEMPDRVKVQLDRSNKSEVVWAKFMMPVAGSSWGFYNKPEVGDKVLLSFIDGNVQDPYILGCVYKMQDTMIQNNANEKNTIRAYKTKTGSEVKFVTDESDNKKETIQIKTPGENTITLDDAGEKISIFGPKNSIVIDQKNGKISIEAEKEISLKTGSTTLEMKKDGSLNINCKKISIEGSQSIQLKGGTINAEGTQVAVKGKSTLKLESTGMLQGKGTPIKLN